MVSYFFYHIFHDIDSRKQLQQFIVYSQHNLHLKHLRLYFPPLIFNFFFNFLLLDYYLYQQFKIPLEGQISMTSGQRQTQTTGKCKSSIINTQHFYFFLSEIKFFKFESVILTVLLFLAWNLPLIRMLQMFYLNNQKITDIYLVAMYNVSRFLFTIEQYVTLYFIDSNFQNSNLLNLIFFVFLVIYAGYFLYLYLKFKRKLGIGRIETNVFRIWTFTIYFICYYMYIVCGTAFIKAVRGIIPRYMPFAIFNLVFIFLIIFLVQYFFNQNQYLSKKALSKLNSHSHTIVHLLKLVLAGCIAFRDYFPNKNNFVCLFMVASSLILACEFKNILANVAYINERTITIYQFFTFTTFVTYLNISIFYLTRDYGLINNTIFIVITVNILGLWALSLYKERKREKLFQGAMPDTRDESQLTWRMIEYIKLMKNQCNSKFSFSSLSIIKHIKECDDLQCFCLQYRQRNGAELINNKLFLQKFIISRLKALKQQNNQSFYLKMISINFKLIFLQSFTQIYTDFQKINLSNVNMNEWLKRYIIYQFKRQFQLKVDQHSRETNMIKLKELFQEEFFRQQLMRQLQGISSKNIKKYTLLSQDFCSLNKIYQITSDITKLIKNIQIKWIAFKRMDTYNMRILQIFLIYFQLILPIRIQTSEIKAIINKRVHCFKFLKGTDNVTINKAIYTHRAAVFQIHFNSYDDLRIINVSPLCYGLLQLDKKEVIGKEIHEIMPNYLALAHKELVTQKLSSLDTLKHIDNIRDTYYVDHKGHCFAGKIHTRISSQGNQINFYVLLLREDENNYIVIDDNMMIQGIGRRVEKEQIFYKQNNNTKFTSYCKEDLKELLQSKTMVKKSITISQLTQKIDTKSLIKCNNLESIDENQLKEMFDTINYDCQTEICKHRIKNTFYYTIKFGEIKKSFKVNEAKKNMQQLKSISKRIGTLILGQNNKKIESMTIITQMQIQNKSDVFGKGIMQDNMMAMNETSSTASSYKDNVTLSYTELMVKLKSYLINQGQTPKFHIPFMKIFMLVVGFLIVSCGFIEGYIIQTGINSLAQTYEAGNYLDNINQVIQIALNNGVIMQKYCTSNDPKNARRCNYLNSTQTFLHQQLYSMILVSFNQFLTKQTDMFAVRYYEGLQQKLTVNLNDSSISIPARQFFQLYYYSLRKMQQGNMSSVQSLNNLKFLNSNWALVKKMNDMSINYYRQRAKDQQTTFGHIIYSYNAIYLIVIIAFVLPFYIFLNRCDQKKQTVVRLFQMVDIEFCKKLVENEKMIVPMITEGCVQRGNTIVDLNQKHASKRYSQFIYHKTHKHKFGVLFIFLLLLSLNVTIAATILQYLPVNQALSSNLESLLMSQNSAIEDYINLKMEFFNNMSITRTGEMNSSVQFVQKLKHIFTSFGSTDGQLQAKLLNLTINDVCRLNKGYLPVFQLKSCRDRVIDFMSKGLAASMEYVVRQTEGYSIQFKENPPAQISQYLNNSDFMSMDDQLVFDMRIFQLIKIQIIQSFGRTLSDFNNIILIFNILQLVFVALAIYASMILLFKKQITLRNLFGTVLQIPQRIFNESKLVTRIVTDTLLEK